jgi:hypothetical protein
MLEILPRRPADVMRLDRLGAAFQTRISFSRRLIRRMHKESWTIERTSFDLNSAGYGTAVYVVTTPDRRYSLLCFSHFLDPQQRTDRVIAQAWDATFSLFDGVPKAKDIDRLVEQTTRQEAGRFESSELVLSRANKSVRIFDNVVNSLAAGNQPNTDLLNSAGYLMRTTAVYANGKFGMADRTLYADQSTLASPFQAEMLTVYLIRGFTHDLVEHLAAHKAPNRAANLDRPLKRHLGVGNATGLGMAPFLISHPHLIHNWFYARELGLAKIRSINVVTPNHQEYFRTLLARAKRHIEEWTTTDPRQKGYISILHRELIMLSKWTVKGSEIFNDPTPWNALFRRAESTMSIEGQELLVSLLFEPYPELINDLGEGLQVDSEIPFDTTITVAKTRSLLEHHYAWALAIDFSDPRESRHFWYYSEEKEEPRRGVRWEEPGVEKEMKIAIAQDVQKFYLTLCKTNNETTLATFLTKNADLRHIARRIQIGCRYPYAEIQDNLISETCKPIDVLRAKLAFFGASKFDPKSDLWTRITMYQGAPLTDELDINNADDWCFPIKPIDEPC